MRKYKNCMFAEAGHFLTSSKGNKGIQLPFEKDITYEESPINMTYEENDMGILVGGIVCIKRGSKDIKVKLIKCWYSNDDQIAIMLNKDKGGDFTEDYNLMQGWREWAGQVAKYINEHFSVEEVD